MSGIGPVQRARLVVRVWGVFAVVRRRVRRQPLPGLVAELGVVDTPRPPHPPQRLSRAVDRGLRIGPYRPTCLVNALVLYRLLAEQGDAGELVIGLPAAPAGHEAHAWVELDGVDVGPAPGRFGHAEMARFG